MGAAMRYQPQGRATLDRSSQLVAGAQAIISAAQQTNLASQVALKLAGTVNRSGAGANRAFQFRKNGYVETESLPAIGTASFVEFWYGYPSSDTGVKGSAAEPQFVTGQSTNQMGIASVLGTARSGAPAQWGYVNQWTSFVASGDVAVPGQLTLLIVVRRQTSFEFWRNGQKVGFVATGSPTSYPAGTMICGSFVEDTGYWPTSSDTILAGRILGEWSADQVRQFSANPWQIFTAGSNDSAYFAALAATGVPSLKSFAYSALGGAVFGGSAAPTRSISRVPVGSLTMGGSGQAIRGAARTAQGGLALSGAGSVVRSVARAAAGGLKFAGAAVLSATAQVQARVITPVGGPLLAGAAAVSRATSRAVSGGITFSGHALKTAGAAGALLASLLPIFARRRRR